MARKKKIDRNNYIFIANGEQIVSYGAFTPEEAKAHAEDQSSFFDGAPVAYDMTWTRGELVSWVAAGVAPEGVVEWFDELPAPEGLR